MPSKNKMDDIKYLAEAIALDYWSESYVDIKSILDEKSIKLHESSFGNEFDAVLECSECDFSIYLNNDRGNFIDSERGRFTLGHELGHYFIDEHRRPMEHGWANPHPSKVLKSNLPIEREADWFSSNLLMPEDRFRKAAKSQRGLECIQRLSTRFRTSFTATALRYIKLISTDSAIIYWRDNESQWCITGQDYYLSNYKGRTVMSPPIGSVTEDLLSRGNAGNIDSRGTVLSEWKSRVKKWQFCNDILKEEAIHLGKHGVLTMLTPDQQF